jgi:uncharacterized damage-inducible protein DinB
MSDDTRRYPIGPFAWDPDSTPEKRRKWTDAIRSVPTELRTALSGLPDGGIDRSYREGGWTVRQIVHHLADGHMNIFVRFKLAMTEESPPVKPFDETTWAETSDGKDAPIDPSLEILAGVHERWAWLLDRLSDDDFAKTVAHPVNGATSLDRMLQYFAWHGRHHVAHIASVR